MTLYYSIVFLLLVLEMIVFLAFILPLPYNARRKVFTFISESPLIGRLNHALRITFIFILILFIDSVNRVVRVQQEIGTFGKDASGAAAAAFGAERMEVQARKFYSQRNMYLCGFTLFLSLILSQTYHLIVHSLLLEGKVKSYEASEASGEDVASLKKQLASKEKDLATLKSQSEGLSREYHKLGDEVSKGNDKTPKKEL